MSERSHSFVEVSEQIRNQIVALARSKHKRVSMFSRKAPTRWKPFQVLNPKSKLDLPFNDNEAWEYIASLVEDDHDIEVIDLKKPPGAKGYVLKVEMGSNQTLYIKVQLGNSKIIGRSFHYSDE